jgi:hypothetical protein
VTEAGESVARDDLAKHYGDEFYSDIREASLRSARRVLATVGDLVAGPVRSVVDVGCGEGSWLAAASEVLRAHEILGIDGAHVLGGSLLRIPRDRFVAHDLAGAPAALPEVAGRGFDLCLSLEVAEHLPPESAGDFVGALCRLAPLVLFSAAIPHQGGTRHVNEQWPGYWVERFAAHGFVPLDAVRPRIWGDDAVAYWYQQNTVLFASPEAARRPTLSALAAETAARGVPAVVHPKLFLREAETAAVLRRRWAVRGTNLLRRLASQVAWALSPR